jgi:hypothetical protein
MPMPVELQYALQSLYVPGAVVIGFIIGLTFADIDLAPPLPLRHRSVWTHSPIIPFGLSLLVGVHPLAPWFLFGFLPAYMVHLIMDCFPKRWYGASKINLYPIHGSLNAPASMLVLAGGAGFSLILWVPLMITLVGRWV